MISVSEAFGLVTYTREEDKLVSRVEGVIDSILLARFEGAPLSFKIDFPISAKVAAAVQHRYQSTGGWRVVFKENEFFFVPGVEPGAVQAKPRTMPALPKAPVTSAAQGGGPRLLVRMPTRSRPLQALDVLEKYRTMARGPLTIEVVLDEDDTSMLNAEVLQRLVSLQCKIFIGKHASKIEAVNSGAYDDWDILMLASDDMVPVVEGYDVKAVEAMQKFFSYYDGAVFYSDNYQGDHICTLPILGRRLWEQFDQQVYESSYKSLFSDTEQTELLKAMGRLAYVDECIIEHRHYNSGKARKDALYERNDLWNEDETTFNERKATRLLPMSQFAFAAPPLWLTIGIATLPERKAQLDLLVNYLLDQIGNWAPREVEILIDSREDTATGVKRDSILQRAKGYFIAYVDDDDWVAPDYVRRIVECLRDRRTEVDCVSLTGQMTTDGANPETFHHSLEFTKWETVTEGEASVHLRTPNHLNAVRTELARQVGFKPISFGEDHDYSKRLYPLLKKESRIEGVLYYYFYRTK